VLVSPVGAGGLGEVWKARDTRVDRIVAIKWLKAEYAERFKRETRAIAALNHPHICQLYDVGPDYLVMEFVEGTPLKGPVPIADALRLAGQIPQPVPPRIRWLYGQYLSAIGKDRAAIEEVELALHEDPLHLLCRCHLAGYLNAVGKRADAIRQVNHVLEIDERFGIAYWCLAMFQALEGTLGEARASAERAYSLMPWEKSAAGFLGGLAARDGDTARAESLLAQLAPGMYLAWATYHLARLETDQAADWIGKAIDERDPRVMFVVPYMRTSSRWPALAKMMNLPAAVP
jgi:tetratricopeptide (TPR) repeat protein